ncbi:MAG: methyltransferase family protein, partial [Calditrichia bacterium]
LLLRWWAIFTLRKYFTVNVAIVEGHKIIQKGLYKKIRHPSYSGSLISFLGLGITFASWASILIIFIPIYIAFLHRINIEERALLAEFGDEYRNYMNHTARLIPKLY